MHANYLDRYSRLQSPIHQLPASLKVTGAMAMVVAVLLLPARVLLLGGRPHIQPTAWLLLIPAALLLVIAIISRVPRGFLLRRLILLEPLVLGVAALAIFGPGGWRAAAILMARCTLCLATMILLSNTTPFSDLLHLLRKLRVPPLMITTLALMYRYLFVLIDESQRMKRARMSRTFAQQRSRQWKTTATVVSQLFVRASERAERIYAAMCARGWQ